MSNPPIQITTDLSQILNRIEQKIDRLDEKFEAKLDNLSKDVSDLRVGQARLEEKVDALKNRVESQEFISRGVVIGLIVAILAGLAKLFGWVGNP